MKSLKVLCAIGMLSLLFSCAHKEDTVAFFLDNELNNSLTIESGFESTNSRIFRHTELTLTSSVEYNKYIQRLRDLRITKLVCSFRDYQGDIRKGKLFIDGILLGNYIGTMKEMSIDNFDTLTQIAEKFLEKTSVDFYFTGESDTQHYLSVDIKVEMIGTFVH